MHGMLYLLGRYPIAGVLTVLAAGIAFIAWEYIRMERDTRRIAHLPFVRRAALITTVLSVVLIISRFVAVAKLLFGKEVL